MGKEQRVLEHDAYVPLFRRQRHTPSSVQEDVPSQLDGSLLGAKEPGDHIQDAGLAAAGRSE